jgi:cellulose synthase operon protein B
MKKLVSFLIFVTVIAALFNTNNAAANMQNQTATPAVTQTLAASSTQAVTPSLTSTPTASQTPTVTQTLDPNITPTVTPTIDIRQGVLAFTDLGAEKDLVLRGPYDQTSIQFHLPASWALQAGAELEVVVSAFSVGTSGEEDNSTMGAVLEVSMNEKLLKSIPLTFEENIVYKIGIPYEYLSPPYDQGNHRLSFFLNASVDCDLEFHDTTVVVHNKSTAYFPHGDATLALDLRRLPWPLYMEYGKIVEPIYVVLPSAPSAAELQASFVLMGALGRMTDGGIKQTTITADQLTDEMKLKSHLILVGKPSSFPILSEISLPISLTEGLFSAPDLKADDGVVQLVISPWNKGRVVLTVSGNNDSGVVKAAQALSTGSIQTGVTPNYSFVAQINPYPSTGLVGSVSDTSVLDITFADLGYSFDNNAGKLSGWGTHWESYAFMIPFGQQVTQGASLELNISSSTLIDTARSEGIVYVNGVQIGSIKLSSVDSNLVTSTYQLPLSTLQTGANRLELVFNLLPLDSCSLFTFADLWVTIYPDSAMHLPLTNEVPNVLPLVLRDFKSYPYPFTNDPSLSTTTFVLSPNDPASWLVASKVALDLGSRVSNPVLGYQVVFDGQMPEELKANNLILIGQPKNLSILSELKDSMPARFDVGSNIAVLESQQVVYRISGEKSLGYLQMFASPWNEQSVVMGILGTSTDGIGYAVNSLLDPYTRSSFSGNFITLDGGRALFVDTRTGSGLGRMGQVLGTAVNQENKPIPTVAPETVSASEIYNNNRALTFTGILVVLGLIIATIILVVVFKIIKRGP